MNSYEKTPDLFDMQLLANCCSIVHVHHLGKRDFPSFMKKYLEYKDDTKTSNEKGNIAPWPRSWSRNILWIDNYYSGNGQWLAEQLKRFGTVHHIQGVSCNPHGKNPAHVFFFTFGVDKDQNWLAEEFRKELAALEKNPVPTTGKAWVA